MSNLFGGSLKDLWPMPERMVWRSPPETVATFEAAMSELTYSIGRLERAKPETEDQKQRLRAQIERLERVL